MGIYDRHYIRRPPPQPGAYGTGGARGWRTWSVNTWLILICIAVFIVDGFFLSARLVERRTEWLIDNSQAVDRSALIADPVREIKDARGRLIGGEQTVYVNVAGGRIPVARKHYVAMAFLESFLHFSTERGFLKIEFWRLVGFQFLHHQGSLTHILFNMIGLFFFGPMVERYLGSKRYLAFYLLCGICGALLYTLLNLAGFVASELFGVQRAIPGLLFNDIGTPLIGASAGVFGVLMAGAYLAPNATVLVFFILPMRFATLAYVLVAIAFVTLLTGGQNAGGEAGHLGGALAGFYFIRHPRHLHGFFDFVGRIDPTSHHYRGKGAAVRARAVAKTSGRGAGGGGASRAEIDRILDKINTQGLKSLTDREKRLLRQASEKGR